MTTVTARIDEDTQTKLERLSRAAARSRSWLVADAGNFASADEVAEEFARWGVNAR